MGFIRFFLCGVFAVVVTAGVLRVRALGDVAASEAAIIALSLIIDVIALVIILVVTAEPVYDYFYYRPEYYEAPLQAGDTGLAIYIVMLVVVATAFYYIVVNDGLNHRSATIRRQRREARARRRAL